MSCSLPALHQFSYSSTPAQPVFKVTWVLFCSETTRWLRLEKFSLQINSNCLKIKINEETHSCPEVSLEVEAAQWRGAHNDRVRGRNDPVPNLTLLRAASFPNYRLPRADVGQGTVWRNYKATTHQTQGCGGPLQPLQRSERDPLEGTGTPGGSHPPSPAPCRGVRYPGTLLGCAGISGGFTASPG